MIISEDSPSDSVQGVELADRLELVLEIAQHEADEPFGLAPLVARFVARFDRGHCKCARHRHSAERCRSEPRHPPMPPGLLTLDQLVESDP